MLDKLKPSPNSTGRRRRLGRGIGSGLGKTSGRGAKGQKHRRQIHPNFEGGQTPIHRRLPVKKGFRNINKKEFAIINVGKLEDAFKDGDVVNAEVAAKRGLIPGPKDGLKILGFGEITKKLKVTAKSFSKSAEEKITKAGGEVTRL